jgi:hypothetical protein
MNATSQRAFSRTASYEEVMQAGEDAVFVHDYAAAAPIYSRAVAMRDSDTILFGDSHYHMFVGVPGLTPLWMNAVTAHRIGRDGRSFIDPVDYGATLATHLGFCFGEIDVRNHIGRIALVNRRSIRAVSWELAGRYLRGVRAISRGYGRPFVTTTVPQHALGPDQVYSDLARPLEERIEASRAFNAALMERGPRMGVDVIDIARVVADPNGLLRDDVTDDGVHVRSAEGKLAVVLGTIEQLNRQLGQRHGRGSGNPV